MLVVDIALEDGKGRREISQIAIVRGDPHLTIKYAFNYHYRARVDNVEYLGKVLHTYKNGAVALAAKVTRAITKQQKAVRDGERRKIRNDSN